MMGAWHVDEVVCLGVMLSWRLGTRPIVLPKLFISQIDIPSSINILNLLSRKLVILNIKFIIDRVSNSINLAVKSFFNLLLSVY